MSTFWGITAYFNPVGYKSRSANFKVFRESSKAQGLKLLVVELVLEGAAPELAESDADMYLVIHGGAQNLLWQKEALLNIGLSRLPSDCHQVAWLDGDIRFTNHDWIAATTKLLGRYPVVQPYSHFVQLPSGAKGDLHPELGLKEVPGNGKESFGYGLSRYGKWWRHPFGRTGNAWTARRDFLERHGFYDALILGDGDSFMAYAFTGYEDYLNRVGEDFPPALLAHYRRWADGVFADVESRVGYLDGTLLHLWHGSSADRRYIDRRQILKHNQYDPSLHITKHPDGLLAWAAADEKFVTSVADYFFQRKEDEGIDAMNRNKRLLITGMSGVVGEIAGRALTTQYDLRAVSRSNIDGVETVLADIRDVEALKLAFEGIDTVLHFAAYTAGDGIRHIDVNIRGSYNVFEAAVQAGATRVIYISSGAVQEAFEREEPYLSMVESRLKDIPNPAPVLTHLDPVRPLKMYGVAKACVEVMGRMYAETSTLSVLCLRLGRVRREDRPFNSREAAVYLSHRDLVQLVRKSIEAPPTLRYGIYYGVSNNRSRFRDLAPAFRDLGFEPQDGITSWPETAQADRS